MLTLCVSFVEAQAALQAVNAMHSGNMTLSGTATASDGGMMPGQSSVLRIIVENLYYQCL